MSEYNQTICIIVGGILVSQLLYGIFRFMMLSECED